MNHREHADQKSIPLWGGPGKTSFFACQYDQRFSYCMYIPLNYAEQPNTYYPLFVVVHGSLRNAEEYRSWLIDFAEETTCIVLAPLFPSGIIEPGEGNNYKEITYRDLRYDLILLEMIKEAGQTYRIIQDKFFLYGYSGGGQFSHRFLYLHPKRLRAVSVGAPGSVTLLDDRYPWWVGTNDAQEQFGIDIDIEALRNVPVQLVVGGEDNESLEQYDRLRSMPGGELAGANRIEKLKSLRDSLESHGIETEFEIVPGLAHENRKFLPTVTRFFRDIMRS